MVDGGWLMVGWLVDGWMLDCGLGIVDWGWWIGCQLSLEEAGGRGREELSVIGYQLSVEEAGGRVVGCRLSVVGCRWKRKKCA
jgi:hypothetical protein